MHEHLWAGVEFKLGSAGYFLGEMGRVVVPPRHRPEASRFAALMASTGAVVHHPWQQGFYYHLDAFLQATRSVPEIIQWNFGTDNRGRFVAWLQALPGNEAQRREQFQQAFAPLCTPFKGRPLSKVRNVSVHRSGMPPVEVQITGRWGCYVGGPASVIPAAESAPAIPTQGDPALQWAATQPPIPIEPLPTDFTLVLPQPGGPDLRLPLVEECKQYLAEARELAGQARHLSQQHHGGQHLTTPPLN